MQHYTSLMYYGEWLRSALKNIFVYEIDEKSVDSDCEESRFLTVTHYFANEWSVNFWSVEWDMLI